MLVHVSASLANTAAAEVSLSLQPEVFNAWGCYVFAAECLGSAPETESWPERLVEGLEACASAEDWLQQSIGASRFGFGVWVRTCQRLAAHALAKLQQRR